MRTPGSAMAVAINVLEAEMEGVAVCMAAGQSWQSRRSWRRGRGDCGSRDQENEPRCYLCGVARSAKGCKTVCVDSRKVWGSVNSARGPVESSQIENRGSEVGTIFFPITISPTFIRFSFSSITSTLRKCHSSSTDPIGTGFTRASPLC